MFLSFCRASGELDGHTGDSPGGNGVPAEVPGGDAGGAAQRGGAVCSRRQENSGHGERHGGDRCAFGKTLRFVYHNARFLNEMLTLYTLFIAFI